MLRDSGSDWFSSQSSSSCLVTLSVMVETKSCLKDRLSKKHQLGLPEICRVEIQDCECDPKHEEEKEDPLTKGTGRVTK